jgi:flagellar biosynthesis GTPase FlhF
MGGVAVPTEDEELALEKHATDLEAKICDEQKKVDLMRSWIGGIKRKREADHAEKERQHKKRREEEERQQKEKREAEERQEAEKLQQAAREVQTEKRKARGECCSFVLHENEHVDTIWNSDSTACVAMGCAGDADGATSCTAMLYDNGGHSWTSGMPKLLHDKLNGRGQCKKPWPVYLAMGSEDRYYLKFEDGSAEWVAGEASRDIFKEKMGEMTTAIKAVAFGDDGSFFILSQGGGYSYRGMPEAMCEGMNSNKYRKKQIDDVSLGPQGEWFVRWTDGSWKGNGWPTNLDDRWSELKREGCSVKKVLFGPSHTWFLRYT